MAAGARISEKKLKIEGTTVQRMQSSRSLTRRYCVFFTGVVVFGDDDDDERAKETIADLAGCVKFRGSLCRPSGGFV